MKIAINFLTSIALFGVLAGAAFVNAAHHEGDEATKKPNIVEVAAGNEDFTTLVAAVITLHLHPRPTRRLPSCQMVQ